MTYYCILLNVPILSQATLTEDTLHELFEQYRKRCGSRKGIELSVFSDLVDDLIFTFAKARGAVRGV